MSNKDIPILQFNRQTGCYEGYVLVQVEGEIFRRLLLQAVEENETDDLTNPQTWTAAIHRIGEITHWIGRPHVKVTSVAKPSIPVPEATPIPAPQPVPESPAKKTKTMLLEERLREQTRRVAPHLWEEQCRTPLGDQSLDSAERDNISRLRYDEKIVLKRLRVEWEAGTFVLDGAAAEEEQRYQQEQDHNLTTKLTTVASAVNGAKFH